MEKEKDLQKKKIEVLRSMAKGFEIELKPTWTKKKIAKLIIERSKTKNGDGVPGPDLRKEQPAPERKEQGPGPPAAPAPAFEQAATVAEPPKERRGGVRAGAGRPIGLTDEKAKVKNLPQYPSAPIKQGLQALFDLWATAAKIEELALKETEADLWSLPITQLAEYYYPNMIPEIAGTWIMMIFATVRIMKPRLELLEKVRKERRAARDKTPANDDRIYHFKTADGRAIHAFTPGQELFFETDPDKVNCEICRDIISVSGQN